MWIVSRVEKVKNSMSKEGPCYFGLKLRKKLSEFDEKVTVTSEV